MIFIYVFEFPFNFSNFFFIKQVDSKPIFNTKKLLIFKNNLKYKNWFPWNFILIKLTLQNLILIKLSQT